MPELPEVETIKLGLRKLITGRKILNIEIREKKIFQGDKDAITGSEIKSIERIGKGLLIYLDKPFVLAIHLKLTGQLIYQDEKMSVRKLSPKTGGLLPSKYTRVIFSLNNNANLYFNDLRKFGWIKVIKKNEVNNLPFFKHMGPEPFAGLTFEKFKQIISKPKSPIKIILMDQKKIAGIGNIYANEALFESGIDPRRSANSLKDEEAEKLYRAVLSVLEKGIKYGGSSDENYVNAYGQDGQYQHHFLIYSREKKQCIRCGQLVKKIKIGGRGTYFCENCQH